MGKSIILLIKHTNKNKYNHYLSKLQGKPMGNYLNDEMPDWLKKCMRCSHAYYKQTDADTIYCRCRNGKCNFKEYKSKTERKRLK